MSPLFNLVRLLLGVTQRQASSMEAATLNPSVSDADGGRCARGRAPACVFLPPAGEHVYFVEHQAAPPEAKTKLSNSACHV